MELEHFLPPIFSWYSDIMMDTSVVFLQTLFAWSVPCRLAQEFQSNFTIAVGFFKNAAELDEADDINKFDYCLKRGHGVDEDID
jgi:hypothetical protein